MAHAVAPLIAHQGQRDGEEFPGDPGGGEKDAERRHDRGVGRDAEELDLRPRPPD
jgi:hypothetical protein